MSQNYENVEPLKASATVPIQDKDESECSKHAIKTDESKPIQKEVKESFSSQTNVSLNEGDTSQEQVNTKMLPSVVNGETKDFLHKEKQHYHDEHCSRSKTETKPKEINDYKNEKYECSVKVFKMEDNSHKRKKEEKSSISTLNQEQLNDPIHRMSEEQMRSSMPSSMINEITNNFLSNEIELYHDSKASNVSSNTAEFKHLTHPEKSPKDSEGYSKQLEIESTTTIPIEKIKEDPSTKNDKVIYDEEENLETLRSANSTFISIEKGAYDGARDIEKKIHDPLMKQTQNVIDISPQIENVNEEKMNVLPDEINKMSKDFLCAEKEQYDGEQYSLREPQTYEIHSQQECAMGERETENIFEPETADEIHEEITGESEDPKEKPKKSSIFKFFKGKSKKETKSKSKSKEDKSQNYENVEPLQASATVPIEGKDKSEYSKYTVKTDESIPIRKVVKETFASQTNVPMNEGDTLQEPVNTNMLPSVVNEKTKDFLHKEKQHYHDGNYSRPKTEIEPNEINDFKDEKYECDNSQKQEKVEERSISTSKQEHFKNTIHRIDMSEEQTRPSMSSSMMNEITNSFLSNEIKLYNDAKKASNVGLRSEFETVKRSEQDISKTESHKLTNRSDNIEEEKGMLSDRIENSTSKMPQENINKPKTLEEPNIDITMNEGKEATACFLLEETKNYDRSVNYPCVKENRVSLKSGQSVPQKSIEEKPLTEKHTIETANEKIQKELTVNEDEKIEETNKVTTKRKKSGIFNYLKGKFKKSRSVEADTSKEECETIHEEMLNATSSFLTEEKTRYEDGKPSITLTPLEAMESKIQKDLIQQSVEHIPIEDEINIDTTSAKTSTDTSKTASKETRNAESDVKKHDKENIDSKQNGHVKKVSFDESMNINRELAMITQSFLEKEKNYDCDPEKTSAKISTIESENLKISDHQDDLSKTKNNDREDLLVSNKQPEGSNNESQIILEPHEAGSIKDIEKKELKTKEDKIMTEDHEKIDEPSKSYKKKGILGFLKKKSKDTEEASLPLATLSDNETFKKSDMDATKEEAREPTTTAQLDNNRKQVGIELGIQDKSHSAEESMTKKKQKKTQMDNESTEPKGILGFLFKKKKPKNKEETSTYQAAEDFSKILEDTKTFLDRETEMYQDTRRSPSKNTSIEQKTQEELEKLPEKEVIREEMTQVATSNLENIESHDIERKEEELIDEVPEYTAFDFIKEEIETFEKTRLPCTSKVDSSIRIETEVETVEGDSPKEIITKKIFVTERLVETKDDIKSDMTSQEILKKLMDANEDLKAQLNAQENENQTIFRIQTKKSQSGGQENRTGGKRHEDNMKRNRHEIFGGEFVENIDDVELARSNIVEDVSIFEEKVDIPKNRNQEVVTDLDDITSDEHSSINSQNTEEIERVIRGKSPINEENISRREEILTSQASPDQRIEKSRNKRGSITKFNDQGGTLSDVVNVTEDLVTDLKIEYSPYPKRREGFKNVEKDDEDITCEGDKVVLSNRKRKPIFRIESEEENPSVPENNSANEEIDSLIRGLVSEDVGGPVETIRKNIVDEGAVSDGRVDIETIEKKLFDLGKALETLEKLEDSEPSEKNEVRERKLRRIERKFEHMASETNESPPENKQSIEISNSPKTEQYQELVSQLSQDEVMSFQGDYNNLWDEYTFSKTDDWNSKTPDSQADVLELPQGDIVYMAPVNLNKDHNVNKAGVEVDVIPIMPSPHMSPDLKKNRKRRRNISSSPEHHPAAYLQGSITRKILQLTPTRFLSRTSVNGDDSPNSEKLWITRSLDDVSSSSRGLVNSSSGPIMDAVMGWLSTPTKESEFVRLDSDKTSKKSRKLRNRNTKDTNCRDATLDKQTIPLIIKSIDTCKELTDASQNIPTNIQPPQPKPRHQKSKEQPDEKDTEPDTHPAPAQDDPLDENEEIEDISYQDKKKFWENIAKEPNKKPTKRNSVQETTAPPVPKPRGTLQYSYSVAETTFERTTIVENKDEKNIAKTTNIESQEEIHTVSSTKDTDSSIPTQMSSDLLTDQTEESEKPEEPPKEIQKSDSVDTDTDGREDSSSQADNAGYISDSGDVEHYISDSEIEDRVPQIRERQMSVFVPPSVSQRTRYERSASLPTEDLYEVSARSTKLRKQYYEEQIKKEMIKEQLTIELEDEGSPERKCLSSPEMKPEEPTTASVPTNERSDVIFESEFEEEDSREDHKNLPTSKDEASEIHVDKSETEKSEKLIHSNVPSPEQKAPVDVQENIPEITFTLSGKQRRISEESDEYAVEEAPKISPVPEEVESNIEESQEVQKTAIPAVSEKHDTEAGDPFEESNSNLFSEARSTTEKLITSEDLEEIQDLASHTQLEELEASTIIADKIQDEISKIQTAKEEPEHEDILEGVQISGSINVEHTSEVKPATEKLEQAACSSEGTDEMKLPETLQKSEEKLLAESILDAEIADIDLESEDLKNIVSRLESMHKFRKLRASTKLPIKIKKPEIPKKETTEDVKVIDSKQESHEQTMTKSFGESKIPKQIGGHSIAKIQSTDKELEKTSSHPVKEPETLGKHIEEEANQKSVTEIQKVNEYQTSEIESSSKDIKVSEEIEISKDIQEPISSPIEPSCRETKLEDTKLEQEEYTMNQSETSTLVPEQFEISKGFPEKCEGEETKEIPSTEVYTSDHNHEQLPLEHESVNEELQKGNYKNIEMETKTSECVDIMPIMNVKDENSIPLTDVTEITQEELDKSSEIELTTEKHLNDKSEDLIKEITIPTDEDLPEEKYQHSKKTSQVEFSEIMADTEVSPVVLESESDKFSTKINQPQENIENTIWEVSVESEMLKEEKLTSLRTASHQESIGTRSDSLSDKVIDDNTTDETNLDQEPSDSLPSNKLEFDGHDDMKRIILDSLHQQKVDPEEAKLIANSLIEEIEMEIQKVENFNRGLSSKSDSLDSEKHVTDYLKELAETKGLDQREVELVESVLERRQRQISRLSRGDTQASSMEITDEDLRYSETEYDYSNVLQQQMGQLEAEHSDHLKNFDSLVEDQVARGDSPLSTKPEDTRESVEEKGDKDKEEQKCEKSFIQRRDIILEEDENVTESLSDELDVKKIKPETEEFSTVHFTESVSNEPDVNKTKSEREESSTVHFTESVLDEPDVNKTKPETEDTSTGDEMTIEKTETQTQNTSIVQEEKIESPKPQICDQKEQLINEKEQIEQQTEGHVYVEPSTEKTESLVESEDLTNLPISEQLDGQCPEKYSLEESEKSEEKVSSKENIQRTSSSDSKSSIGSSKTPDEIYSTCSSSKKLDSEGSPEVVYRKYRKHEESASRKADRKSALELETYSSSGESHYHSFEIDSKSRPCSSDVEGLLPTGSSEYESALNSQDLSMRSQVTSGEYHTAISSLSSKESMMSIESESSGNLASIEVSETSETLVPTNSDLEGDIDMADQQIFEDGEDWQASEFENHEASEDPLNKSSTPPTPKDAVDIPHKMKRSHEMTFQPEPQTLATDSPQTESNDIDEKFATSLDEGSVLSVSLSSTSSAQLRTVIELSRTESGGPEESLTSALSDHISFDDSDLLAKTPENVVLIDSSTSTNAIPKEPIESVTILSASINDNGITSACSQVTTETISQSSDVQKLKNEELKKKGHRRQESTSFIPTLIQGIVKPTEIVFESSSILMDSETEVLNEKISHDKTVDLSIRRESSERRDSHGKSSSTSSEKSSFEEAEAEAAFSMVAHISPVHKIKQICPIIEDIDAEKIESEAKEIARRERIERANQIRDASPGSIPDIKVTEHNAPLDETEFRYPELEIEREELEQENRKTEEIESSTTKEADAEEPPKDETDVLEETDSLEDACVATEAEPLEKPIEDSKPDKGKVPSEKVSNEEERASDSPNSDSFELVERPDIIDDFVVIEEIGKEASEMDSEGKSVAIQAKPKRRKRDEEIDAYLAKSDPTPLTKMTELKYFPDTELEFEFEDSPPQAQADSNAKDYGSRYDQELEANRKWIEQQFHGDHAAMVAAGYGYEMEFERGPLEDIKEEDINDIEGSSRIGSLGSQKESGGSLGSMKDSYSSTPEYDVLAGRRYFTRSGEHDDISMSSLQEFENLERAMSLETKKMYHGSGSQESSNGSFKTRYYSCKGQGDDISASSLKEFEGLEKACIEAHKTEIKVKEEEELLSEMEEKQEVVPETTEKDTTDKSKVTESDEEDYEKRMFEIDEIIRQAQNNVERFTDLKEPEKTESLGRGDSIEEVSKVPDLDLDAPLAKTTTQTTWKEDDPMVASTDSLDLEPSKNIQYGSTDSLDQKNPAVDVMTASTDSIEFNNQISRNITTDSMENKTEGSNMVCSDSLEIAAAVVTRPQLDSLDEDEQKIYADHSSSDTGKDFSSSVRDDADEHIHELMLGSTDSLEPTSSTATHATYQYETDSVFSGSFTSGGSNTMVSSTDTIEQNNSSVDIGIAARKVWFDEVTSASGKNITTEFFEETSMPYVTEVIEPSDDPTFSHTIHRRVQMPVEVRKVTFHGADADEQLEQFIKNFGENEEQVHETEEIDSAGNVHTRRVVQKRFVVKSGDEASSLGKAIHTEGENLEITQRFDVRPQLTTLTKTITGETSQTSEPSDTTTTKDHQASTSERDEEEVRQHQMDQHQLSSEMRDLLREMEEASKK